MFEQVETTMFGKLQLEPGTVLIPDIVVKFVCHEKQETSSVPIMLDHIPLHGILHNPLSPSALSL